MSDETISRPTDPHATHRRALPPGTPACVGRYEVLRVLGNGSFGRVYLAFDPKTERYVAIKTPNEPLPPKMHAEFLREARIVAQLEDPNICPVYDVGVQDDLPFIVMRYVGGGTLLDVLERGLPSPANALRMTRQIAKGLEAAHASGVFHRDLKPANVLYDETRGVLLLTDFGVARWLDTSAGTTTGGLKGSPGYMAPEQWGPGQFGDISARTDVYSLGVVLFQLLTGQILFAGTTQPEQMFHHCFTAPRRPSDVRPGLDSRLDALCLKALAKPQGDRYGSAKEFATAIADYLRASGTAASVERVKPPGADRSPVAPALPEDEAERVPWSDPDPVRAGAPTSPTIAPAETSALGSKPVLLPEPEERPAPRTVPPPLPPPRPRTPPPEPLSLPDAEPERERDGDKPRRSRGFVALVAGSVIALGLAVGIALSLLPLGKRSAPTQQSARKDEPKGAAPLAATKDNPPVPSGGKTADTPPEPKAKAPEPKAKSPEPIETAPEPKPAISIPKAGDTRDIEIAPGVKMTFCWVPAGECQLGSPKEEVGHQDDEDEAKRPKFKTDGFWMGKYTVTQAEWKAAMGDNPSYFDGTKANEAKGMDTRRFPVETVSWDRICGRGKYVGEGFLDKINAHGGIQKIFGKPGKFKLPTEDEWEYAARVGRGNEQPFYWGKVLNGAQANIDGNFPFGTTEKGTSLGRTCAVDATDDTMGHKYEQHPWGLMHMHGNVWQWCEYYYDKTDLRCFLRGGSWNYNAHASRAANRNSSASVGGYSSSIGFRLVVPGLP